MYQKTVCSGKGQKKKRQTHYFKPFITCINISSEINKGWAGLFGGQLQLAALGQRGASAGGLLGCQAYQSPVKPLHLFLIIHLELGDWRSCQGELLRQPRMDVLFRSQVQQEGRSRFFVCPAAQVCSYSCQQSPKMQNCPVSDYEMVHHHAGRGLSLL